MKAENFFNVGVKGGYFLLTGKAERSKGSAPSSRPVASKPKRRGGDPIALVRLRKLGILIGHDMLNYHPDTEVSDKIFRKYTGLINSDVIAHEAKGKITLEDALHAVHAGISAHEARIASEGHKKWRSLFSGQFGVDGWRAGSSVIHEQADCPSFNAESMSQDWTKIWRPEDPSSDVTGFRDTHRPLVRIEITILHAHYNRLDLGLFTSTVTVETSSGNTMPVGYGTDSDSFSTAESPSTSVCKIISSTSSFSTSTSCGVSLTVEAVCSWI